MSRTILEGDRIAADVEADLIGSLDSFHLGHKEFLSKHLGPLECLIIWHVPIVHSQELTAVLVWREVQDDCYLEPDNRATFRRHKAAHKQPNQSDLPEKIAQFKEISVSGTHDIVCEWAKSNTDANRLKYCIQGLLTGTHTRPAPRKLSASQDALVELSQVFLSLCFLNT